MSYFTKRNNPDNIYIYSLSEYESLVKAAIASSAISMLSSLFIILFYMILRRYNPAKTNRVSLRCVLFASWMNMIDAIFDICLVLLTGDTALCRSTGIVRMFARVMSAALLALVGINLVLIFVINVSSRTAKRLEWAYYVGALIYGFVTISVPISEETKYPLDPDSTYKCYYHVYYYQILGQSSLLWMWFYGFLFLTTVIAMSCSIIASIKLLHEHRSLLGRFSDIAESSHYNQQVEEQQSSLKKSNILTKVVSRCVIYPLVPFISSIWGFIVQTMLVSPHVGPPNFPLALIDTIFASLQGFFVAIVFFSDPSMFEFICQGVRSWKQKYMDEYSQVCKYNNGDIKVVSSTEEEAEEVSIPLPAYISPRDSDCFLIENKRYDSYEHSVTTVASTVPMRRIDISPSVYSRLSITPAVSRPSSTTSIKCIVDPESNSRVLVPYKYPKIASLTHWFMKRCGIRSHQQEKESHSNSNQHHL